MADRVAQNSGRLLLRLMVGGMMLMHGIDKMRHGVGGLAGLMDRNGLPEFFAYGVYVGEVVAPVLVVLGVLTRLAGLTVAVNMVVAIALAHSGDLFALSKHGAWSVELQMFYVLGALSIALLGPGRYALSRRGGWLG